MRVRRSFAFAFLAVLAACSPRGAITLYPDAAETGVTRTVFVGTTRGFDGETGDRYGFLRSPSARFARFDIAVPPDRTPGEIDWPTPRQAPDPATQFLTTHEEVYSDTSAFRTDLARALRSRPAGKREAIVFVHGFNNTFAEGLYRVAQLGHDLNLEAVTVHYAWPSRANPLGYAYDRDSALFARDGLQDLLDQVAAAGAESIVLVAHSMGSALAMETLRQVAISGDRQVATRLEGVILISPDIDVDVFRAQAARIGRLPKPFVIFTSKKDRALALSARLTGQRDRLGNLSSVEAVADLDVTLLDVSAFSKGLGHFAVGDSPALLAILGQVADIDSAFAGDQTGRTGLLPGVVLTVQSATEIVLSPVTVIAGAAN